MDDESPTLLLNADDAYALYAAGRSDALSRDPDVPPSLAILIQSFRVRWLEEYMARTPLSSDAPDWLKELAEDRTVLADERPGWLLAQKQQADVVEGSAVEGWPV